MNQLLVTCLLLLFCISAKAQIPRRDNGEWVDSVLVLGKDCAPVLPVYYYDLEIKYPVSSARLLDRVIAQIADHENESIESGYITFQFFVNCEGKTSRFRLFQTDMNYKPYRFHTDLVNALFEFTKGLDRWPHEIEAHGISRLNYFAYVSYKIKNGMPVAVIP